MPDKVAFVSSAYLITAVTRKPLYLPLQQRLLLAENETAFANMWETLVSVNKHKQKFIFECKGHIIKKNIYIYIRGVTISQTEPKDRDTPPTIRIAELSWRTAVLSRPLLPIVEVNGTYL